MWRAATGLRSWADASASVGRTSNRGAPAASERRRCMSVGAFLADNGSEGLQHDVEVQRERPVLDVELVQMDRLFGGHPAPAVDLPPAGHPGRDLVSRAEQLQIRGDLVGGKWAGADEAHLSLEDVPELRELVEAEAAQDLPDRGQARVGLELEEGGRGVRRAVDAQPHRAELEHLEDPATLGDALLTEENRSARAEADGDGDRGPEGNADHQGGRCHQHVEGALHRYLRPGQPDGPDRQ